MLSGDRALRGPKAWLAGGVEALQDPSGGDVGDHLARRLLETELAPLDELHGRGCGDGLGHRSDPHDRIGRHRRFLTKLPLAESTLVDNCLIGRGHYDNARHRFRLDRPAQDVVDTPETVFTQCRSAEDEWAGRKRTSAGG